MSKQLKYKFKKILKKAEFIHADLEYHREVLPEAKTLFSEAIAEIIRNMSPEDQKTLETIRESRLQKELLAREKNDKTHEMEYDESKVTGFNPEGEDPPDESNETKGQEGSPSTSRKSEVKKLFRQIAEQTHPDKTQARGMATAECNRLETIFKKARDAYNTQNWYLLYCIAIDLELPIDTEIPPQECLEWVEEDIRQTLVQISGISQLLAWLWFSGDNRMKEAVIDDYFRQTYGRPLIISSTD
jgi:DnaJ-domain-containing protein 1